MKKLKTYLVSTLSAILFDLLGIWTIDAIWERHHLLYKEMQTTGESAPYIHAVYTDPLTWLLLAAAAILHAVSLALLIRAIHREESGAVPLLILLLLCLTGFICLWILLIY